MFDSGPDNYLVRRTKPTPVLFKKMLRGIRAFGGRPSMMLIEAWNEFHEDSVIEPTIENGVKDLKQVKRVFKLRK